MDWQTVYSSLDANEAYENFIGTFLSVYDNNFPMIEKLPKRHNPNPYITRAIANSMKEKRRLHRLSLRWPTMYKDTYIAYRNNLNSIISQARNNYFKDKLQSSAGDPKSTWKVMNGILGRTQCDCSEIKHNVPDKSTEDVINDFFIDSIEVKLWKLL